MNSNQYFRAMVGFSARSGANSIFWMTTVISLLALHVPNNWISYSAGAMTLASILLDLPSGALTDRIGSKKIVQIAGLVDTLAFLSLLFVPFNSSLVLIGYLLKGGGFAFESGAYRLLILELANQRYGSDGIKTSAIHIQYALRFGTLIGLGAGGYLASIDPRLPWILATILMIINTASVSFLSVDAPVPSKTKSGSFNVREYLTPSSALMVSIVALLPIIFLQLADGFRDGTDGLTFGPYFSLVLGGPQNLWILPLFMIPIRIFGTSLTKHIPESVAPNGTIATFLAIGFSLLLMSYVPTPIGGIFGLTLAAFGFSLNQVWLDIWTLNAIHKDSPHRATALSGMSTLKSIVTSLGYACVGSLGLLSAPYTSAYLLAGSVTILGAGLSWLTLRTKG